MWIVSSGDNSHEMLNPIFLEKKEKMILFICHLLMETFFLWKKKKKAWHFCELSS